MPEETPPTTIPQDQAPPAEALPNLSLPEERPDEFGPLTHFVEVRTFIDNRGIRVDYRRTEHGMPPRDSFHEYHAYTKVMFPGRPDGITIDAAIRDATTILEAFTLAPGVLLQAKEALEARVERAQLTRKIKQGALGHLGGPPGRPQPAPGGGVILGGSAGG